MKRFLISTLVAVNLILAVSLFAPKAQTPVMAATSSTLVDNRDCCKNDAQSLKPYCCASCCWTKQSCKNC